MIFFLAHVFQSAASEKHLNNEKLETTQTPPVVQNGTGFILS